MNKKYWRGWLEKLFSIPISFSAHLLFWSYYFQYKGWIGDVCFSTLVLGIISQRVYKDVKEMVLNNNNNNNNKNNNDKETGKYLAKMIAKAKSGGKE